MEGDDETIDWDDLPGWEPSERACPKCGSPTEEGGWWDDHPDNGGACIGTQWRCTREGEGCDWADSA